MKESSERVGRCMEIYTQDISLAVLLRFYRDEGEAKVEQSKRTGEKKLRFLRPCGKYHFLLK